MDRQEFFKTISEYRKSNGVGLKQLCLRLEMLPSDVCRLERGTNNANINRIAAYLSAINAGLFLEYWGQSTQITDTESVAKWLEGAREGLFSQKEIADAAGITKVTIVNIERVHTIVRIDTILKLANALGWEVKIKQLHNNQKRK